jgi:hypothetical protein
MPAAKVRRIKTLLRKTTRTPAEDAELKVLATMLLDKLGNLEPIYRLALRSKTYGEFLDTMLYIAEGGAFTLTLDGDIVA